MADKLEKSTNIEKAIKRVIRTTLTDHQRIIFNGNGYSSEWINEANKRGLPNAKSFVDAIPALTDQNTIDLYEKHHVLTKKELSSRADVDYELYSKTINIEALTMIDMIRKEYIPSILKYLNDLCDTYQKMKTIHPLIECESIFDLIKKNIIIT